MNERCGSFPYFALSQDHGIPYAEVLTIADLLAKYGLYDPIFERDVYCLVENVFLMEEARRASVRCGGR